jgi:uncharacterized RDD family membrane protein YckC
MSEPYQSATEQDAFPPPTVPSFPQAPPVPAPIPEYGYGYGQFAGQPLPTGTHLDQRSSLVLPDGVELASTGRRIGAYFLAIPLAIITLGIGYVVWGLIIWRKGQTPALQVLGMRCWRPETQRVPGFWWMALREVVGRLADGILGPITEIISFVLMMTSQDRKSLHDMIAGTVVVHDPNKVLSS